MKNSPSGLLLDEKVAGNRRIRKLVEKFASFPIMGQAYSVAGTA